MLVCIHLHTLEELNWDHVNELTGWGEGYWVPASGGLGYHSLLRGPQDRLVNVSYVPAPDPEANVALIRPRFAK